VFSLGEEIEFFYLPPLTEFWRYYPQRKARPQPALVVFPGNGFVPRRGQNVCVKIFKNQVEKFVSRRGKVKYLVLAETLFEAGWSTFWRRDMKNPDSKRIFVRIGVVVRGEFWALVAPPLVGGNCQVVELPLDYPLKFLARDAPPNEPYFRNSDRHFSPEDWKRVNSFPL